MYHYKTFIRSVYIKVPANVILLNLKYIIGVFKTSHCIQFEKFIYVSGVSVSLSLIVVSNHGSILAFIIYPEVPKTLKTMLVIWTDSVVIFPA